MRSWLSVLVLSAFLMACSADQVVDIAVKTVEGALRSACADAGNCRNLCPDGREADPGPAGCRR